jgi:predicted aspartyl protease
VGVFEVPVVVRNWLNPYLPEGERGEEVACDALVDSGAVQFALPAELIERLKVIPVDIIRGCTADGAFHELRVMGFVEMEVQGRTWHGQVIELPRRARPLLGMIPLEEMDWHIAAQERRLVPNPRNPEGPVVSLA